MRIWRSCAALHRVSALITEVASGQWLVASKTGEARLPGQPPDRSDGSRLNVGRVEHGTFRVDLRAKSATLRG